MTSPLFATPSRRAVVGVAALVAVVVIAALAANADPGPLYEVVATKTPKPLEWNTADQTPPSASARPSMTPRAESQGPPPAWVGDLIRFVVIVGVLLLVARFVMLLRRNLRERGQRKATAQVDASAVELPEIDEDEVVESFAGTLSRLRGGGDVDEAILECWRRLVDLAQESGVTRQPTQTAEEFTLEVLAHSRARDADLAELADLYRDAMFSTHGAGEGERARAIACLERLHDALSQHVAETVPPAAPEEGQ